MERSMTADDEVNAQLDEMITRTANSLATLHAQGIPPHQAMCLLIGAFTAVAETHTAAHGAAAYAVAIHRLVKNRARITELENTVAMLETLIGWEEV